MEPARDHFGTAENDFLPVAALMHGGFQVYNFNGQASHDDTARRRVFEYLESKRQRLRDLMKRPDHESNGHSALYRQCYVIADTIRRLQRSTRIETVIVELLMEQAEYLLSTKKIGAGKDAQKLIHEADGYSCSKTDAINRLQVKVNMHNLEDPSLELDDRKRTKLCYDTLDILRKISSVAKGDQVDELRAIEVELNGKIEEIKQSQRAAEQKDGGEWRPSTRVTMKDTVTFPVNKHLNATKKQSTTASPSKAEHKQRGHEYLRKWAKEEQEERLQKERQMKEEEERTKKVALERAREPVKGYKKLTCAGVFKTNAVEPGATCSSDVELERPEASKRSLNVYRELSQYYEIRLACCSCIDAGKLSASVAKVASTNSIDYFVKLLSNDHSCGRYLLLLRPKDSKVVTGGTIDSSWWIHIRPCPVQFIPDHKGSKAYKICERIESRAECPERSNCIAPHSETEHRLWSKYFSSSIPQRGHASHSKAARVTMEKFVDDLRRSSLLTRYEIEQLGKVRPGRLVIICQTCREGDQTATVTKRSHGNSCERGHEWTRTPKRLVFIPDDDKNAVVPFEEEVDKMPLFGYTGKGKEEIRRCLRRLRDLNASEIEVANESNKWNQRRRMQYRDGKEQPVEAIEVTEESPSVKKAEYKADILNASGAEFDEDSDVIYEDSDLDDIRSVGSWDSDESEDENPIAKRRENYYNMESHENIRKLLAEDPRSYKRCRIALEGPFQGRCQILDESLTADANDERLGNNADTGREVEVRGRMNCGMCFSGDEVVVRIRGIKALDSEKVTIHKITRGVEVQDGDDKVEEITVKEERKAHDASGDKIIYRGQVIGLLKKAIVRKNHHFICRVDEYEGHLMMPLDVVAPKISVMNRDLKSQYNIDDKKIRDELVTVCEMKEGETKPLIKRIVKLNPLRRREMLFIVRYLKWNPRYMYPLGYVTRVIHAGTDLLSSNRILNILHQVPTRPSKLCAAERLQRYDFDEDDDDVDDRRKQLVLSIDPEGCRDIDDALSIAKRPNGRGFVVGVHIADVGRCVKKGDDIDINASKRVTSYYPAKEMNKVYHMLPERISQDLCSLVENEDRRVISVYFEFDANMEYIVTQTPGIRRSVIRNQKKMTYMEAQQLINGLGNHPLVWRWSCYESAVLHLHRIAQKLRQKRLRAGWFYHQEPERPFSDIDELINCESHQLIEEFMILTNFKIAEFLVEKFPDEVPVRRQRAPPGDDLNKWFNNHSAAARLAFYFRQFPDIASRLVSSDPSMMSDAKIALLKSTVDFLDERCNAAWNDADFLRNVAAIVGAEQRHPLHALAMVGWFCIQERAEYVCLADLSRAEDARHYSLGLTAYLQFTSPLRRYMDLVIHRFVAAALDGESAPYTADEIRAICHRVSHTSHQAREYHKACRLLSSTMLLSERPLYLPFFIENFDDDEIRLQSVHLPRLKRNQRTIRHSQLVPCFKPKVQEMSGLTKKVVITWERRLYDTRPFHQYARTLAYRKDVIPLDSMRYTYEVEPRDWEALLRCICRGDASQTRSHAARVVDRARGSQASRPGRREVTSEMMPDELMVYHHVLFEATYQPGTVVALQFGADCRDGYMQPIPILFNLTDEKDLCIEHQADDVKCFASLATEKVLDTYESLEHYQNIWLPILSMESATKAIDEGESLVVNGVDVTMYRSNGSYYGKLYLDRKFCKKRCIKLFNNSKEAEDETSDFMCIRYDVGKDTVRCRSSPLEYTSFIRNVWVGHAVALYVHIDEPADDDDDATEICVDFKLHSYRSSPPDELLEAGRRRAKCTIEFITKLLPDRRMEESVKNIHVSSDLCKSIVLNRDIVHENLIIDYPWSETYDIPQSLSNNASQTKAIRQALTNRFTLIQGPPGTGKTLTGVKLVYWFVRMNRNEGRNHQVLYCGPSNSAVDVAAKMLKQQLGKSCPKLIRVYSEMLEKQVFPIPRDSAQNGSRRGRRYELMDKDEHHDIALHHLIRKESNPFHRELLKYDRIFKQCIKNNKLEDVTDEQIDKYNNLVKDAAVHELKKYEVILCTCSASANPRLKCGANVRQLIVDEAGMVMEPECLVPLKTFESVKQVVLIGDHRQLQPIVKNSVAKDRGLERSLFERYYDIRGAVMLNVQYRMHPEICNFPSAKFYGGQLRSAECTSSLHLLSIWPRPGVPMVFIHIEGSEKSLTISTAEGNEQSKSNEAERDEAVRIYTELAGNMRVPEKAITVLTQYRAQRFIIEDVLKKMGYKNPNVNTVISSQGDEWDYVILSLVRSLPRYEIETKPSIGWCKRNMGFIIDEHQINVAITRARKGLIIIGNQHLLRCNYMWESLLNHFESLNAIRGPSQFPPMERRMQRLVEQAEIPDEFGEITKHVPRRLRPKNNIMQR